MTVLMELYVPHSSELNYLAFIGAKYTLVNTGMHGTDGILHIGVDEQRESQWSVGEREWNDHVD